MMSVFQNWKTAIVWRRVLFTLGVMACASAILQLPSFAGSSTQIGMASYYWHGGKTASGERFNPNGLTAAHRTLKFGTRVKVTHLRTGRSVIVRINDRGPFTRGRIIDLARGAAIVIGLNRSGVARVEVVVLQQRAEGTPLGPLVFISVREQREGCRQRKEASLRHHSVYCAMTNAIREQSLYSIAPGDP